MEKQRDARGRYLAGPGKRKRQSAGEGVDLVGARAGKVEPEAGGETGAAPRPTHCRMYALERMTRAMPTVVKSLLDEAMKGSVPHVKLLMQISGLDKAAVVPVKRAKREKNLEEILKEAWEKDAAARAARDAARAAKHAATVEVPAGNAVETSGFSGLDGGPV